MKINQRSLFRRADPSGQTIGEYVRKELSDKVGGADVFVGLPDSGTSVDNYRLTEHLLLPSWIISRGANTARIWVHEKW